jgi:hypothetical protein
VVATTASLDADALCSARVPTAYEQFWGTAHVADGYLPTNAKRWHAAFFTMLNPKPPQLY